MIFFSLNMKSKRIKSLLSSRSAIGESWQVRRVEYADTKSEILPAEIFVADSAGELKRNQLRSRTGWVLTAAAGACVLLFIFFGRTQNAVSDSSEFNRQVGRSITPVMNLSTEIIGTGEHEGKIIVFGRNGSIFTKVSGDDENSWTREPSAQINILDNEERLWAGIDEEGKEVLVTGSDSNITSIYFLSSKAPEKIRTEHFRTSVHQSVLVSGNSIRTKENWSKLTKFKEVIEDADCWKDNCAVAMKNTILWMERETEGEGDDVWVKIPVADRAIRKQVCVAGRNSFITSLDNRTLEFWNRNTDGSWSKQNIIDNDTEAVRVKLLWAMDSPTGEVIVLAAREAGDSAPALLIEIRLANRNSGWHKSIKSTPLPSGSEIKFVKKLSFSELLLFTSEGLVYSYK